MIYFDNAATTFPKPKEVYDGINYAMQNYSFNAGRSSYKGAKDTYSMIEETRTKLANIVNTSSSNVVFTSSATESLNLILRGCNLNLGDKVLVSPFEHNAVIRTLHDLKVEIIIIPFDKETWSLKENELKDIITLNKPKLVAISHVNNVTGFELPYEKIFELCKQKDCITVLDCAQSFAIYPVDTTNTDFVVFAGHKSLYAMFGIAGYIKTGKTNLNLTKVGGTGSDSLNLEMPTIEPLRFEPGSPNSIGIYSINCAIDFLQKEDYKSIKKELTNYLINELKKIDGVTIYLPKDYISCGIVSFNVQGFMADDLGTILAEEFNICVRTGYHCAPYIHNFLDSKKNYGTVRVSLGIFNTKEEIKKLITALSEVV